MVINIIGDCDRRPVLYTVLKVCQTLGDVLLVTNNTHLNRLSDTGETYGHYQNIMVGLTQESIDDFLEEFDYALNSFAYSVVDNIPLVDADVYIYVEGMIKSENEKDNLEFMEGYKTIKLYPSKAIDAKTMLNLERFESLRDCCPIGAKVAEAVAKVLSEPLKMETKAFVDIAMQYNPTNDTAGLNKSAGKHSKGVKITWR